MGNLLFVGHAVFGNHEVKCRFYGPCAVKSVFLNGQKQSSLTEVSDLIELLINLALDVIK